MEHDDKVRSKLGIVISLRDMGNGNSRFFFDDIKGDKELNPITWSHESFYTYTSEFSNSELNQLNLSEEQYKKIGQALVARLVALSGKVN